MANKIKLISTKTFILYIYTQTDTENLCNNLIKDTHVLSGQIRKKKIVRTLILLVIIKASGLFFIL